MQLLSLGVKLGAGADLKTECTLFRAAKALLLPLWLHKVPRLEQAWVSWPMGLALRYDLCATVCVLWSCELAVLFGGVWRCCLAELKRVLAQGVVACTLLLLLAPGLPTG